MKKGLRLCADPRNCVNREVRLGSFPIPFFPPPTLINHTVSEAVKHHEKRIKTVCRPQELC